MTSRRPRLKISNTLTVQAPIPAIAVRCSTTSLSGSARKFFASLRLDMNQRASSPMVFAFVRDNPVFTKARGRIATSFEGVSGLVTASLRRAKIAAAAFPETLW